MKKMFVLSGAPGCGKSTLISDLGVEDYTLSADTFRKFFAPTVPVFNDDLSQGTSQMIASNVQKAIFAALKAAVEARAEKGDTLFIDNTNMNYDSAREIIASARKYGYEVFAVDVMGDMSLDELVERNNNRPTVDRVEVSVLEKMVSRRDLNSFTKRDIPVIAPSEVKSKLEGSVVDLNNFDRILVVGDVQGCGTALRNWVAEVGFTDNDVLVFTGDLFDRGIENDDVFQFVSELEKTNRVIKIMGNHDKHLHDALVLGKRMRSTMESIDQMVAAGITHREIKKFHSTFVPVMHAGFADKSLWFTHGGVISPEMHMDAVGPDFKLADDFYIMGMGNRQKTYSSHGDYDIDFDAIFDEEFADGDVYQFHGHRNSVGDIEATEKTRCFNLESGVEFHGGKLTGVVITRKGGFDVQVVQVANPVSIPPNDRQIKKMSR